MIAAVDSTAMDLLTSTIIRTVGRVVTRFWGWGGRTVTGTAPVTRNLSWLEILDKGIVHMIFSTKNGENRLHRSR